MHTIILPVRRHLQMGHFDCGPATLKIILDSLGRKMSEKTLMRICHTNKKAGTNPRNLIVALKKLGVKHKLYRHGDKKILEDSIRGLNLCIVDYQAWMVSDEFKKLDAGHYSVIFGFNEDYYYFSDPAKHHTPKDKEWGYRTVRKDLFFKRWKDISAKGEKFFHWMIAVPLCQTLNSPPKAGAPRAHKF